MLAVNRQNLVTNESEACATIRFQMTDVTEWLASTLKACGLTEAEMRQKGGIESGSLSNAKSRNSVGSELAKQIAKGLGKPQTWVFFQLGIIDEDPEGLLSQLDVRALNILNMLEGKTDAQKRAAEAHLESLFESHARGLSGQGDVANREAAGRTDEDRT